MPPRSPRPQFRWRSLAEAAVGLVALVRTQSNARVHLAATLGVAVVGFSLRITPSEWCAVVLACGMVWMAEAFNTAIEILADIVHPGEDPRIGRLKDIAAGAVLASALVAALIGTLIFAPPLLAAFGR